MHPTPSRWAIPLLVGGYVALGLGGLQLCIPPSTSSAIWPAAAWGTVLLLRFGLGLWPWLLLASILTNAIQWYLDGSWDPIHQAPLAAGFAVGTAARAWVGAALVRRYAWRGTEPRHGSELLALILAGPLACSIAALCGSFSLTATGVIPATAMMTVAMEWWVGDCIGMAALWPALLVHFWPHLVPTRTQRTILKTATLSLLVLTTVIFLFLRHQQRDLRDQALTREAQEFANHLRADLDIGLATLAALRAFYESSSHITAEEYRTFTASLVGRHPAIHALAAIEVVPKGKLDAHVARLRSEGYADYQPWEMGPDGRRELSDRPQHYLIAHTAPYSRNRSSHGCDTLTAGNSQQYREVATTLEMTASGPIRLIQETGTQTGTVVLTPYGTDSSADHPPGFVALVMRLGDLLENSIPSDSGAAFRFVLRDALVRGDEGILATLHPDLASSPLTLAFPISLPHRMWTLGVTPSQDLLWKRRDHLSGLTLMVCCLISGMVGILLLDLMTRSSQVQAQVEIRTTELADANRRLMDARDQADAASRAKSEFLAMMSHEIRTPLNGVLGSVDLMMATDLPDNSREYARTIRESSKGLLGILNDILDLSKIESGNLDLEITPCDPRQIADGVARAFAPLAGEHGVDLWCSVDPSCPAEIRTDPARLRQILANLVSNAVKFTEQGRITLELRAVPRGDETHLICDVRDTGIGFDAETRSRLFIPFMQADASTTRRFGGTGLGLAICLRLAKLMRGHLDAVSTPGAGSTFTVDIPVEVLRRDAVLPAWARGRDLLIASNDADCRRACALAWPGPSRCVRSPSEIPPNLSPMTILLIHRDDPTWQDYEPSSGVAICLQRSGGTTPKGFRAAWMLPPTRQRFAEVLAGTQRHTPRPSRSELRILLVEDNAVNRRVVAAQLERLGCRVQTACDGEAAIDLLRQPLLPDLVLMDCQMPVLDGFSATRRIREQGLQIGGRRLPIIALTANAFDEDRQACLAVGMDDFLAKPVTMADLAGMLQRWRPTEE